MQEDRHLALLEGKAMTTAQVQAPSSIYFAHGSSALSQGKLGEHVTTPTTDSAASDSEHSAVQVSTRQHSMGQPPC